MCWHYLLCAGLLWLCLWAKRREKQSLMTAAALLMIFAAAAGFLLVYMGPFQESGKTFVMYVTKYALYSLPVFLFPLAGLAAVYSGGKKQTGLE